LYGLVRKKVNVNSVHGLTIESAILLPAAILTLALLPSSNLSASTWGLLSLSGVFTAVPLLFFGAALRHLSLSALGFLQFVGPTLQFLVAIFIFKETLDPAKLGSFILCWFGIGVYLLDSILRRFPQRVISRH